MSISLKPNHWPWVISTNFAEGLPYAIITTLSVVMLNDMGLGNAEVTAWTSMLAIPWSIKALWSPWVGAGNLKHWMWTMQVVLACCLMGVALGVLSAPADLSQGNGWLAWVLGAFAVGAFASATYDIACDGYYMQRLDKDQQSFFVGIRSTAYRLSMIFASGLLTTLVGKLAKDLAAKGNIVAAEGVADSPLYLREAWVFVMLGAAFVMLLFGFAHGRWLTSAKKEPKNNFVQKALAQKTADEEPAGGYLDALKAFLRKPGLWFVFCFLLFYRLGEALLSKMSIIFLKAPVELGGLGLDNEEYGLIYGTVGVAALIVGGILGGMLVSRFGLGRCVIPLALALNVPDLLYVWMSITQPANRWLIGSLVGVEQFGYGLGFTAYMVYMLQAAQGKYSTAHYAIITALMAIGMMVPSALSGYMQEHLGYTAFFWVVALCTIPGMLLTFKVRATEQAQGRD